MLDAHGFLCIVYQPDLIASLQALTQTLSKLRAKMTHQEKENGGKGEDILVTILPCCETQVISVCREVQLNSCMLSMTCELHSLILTFLPSLSCNHSFMHSFSYSTHSFIHSTHSCIHSFIHSCMNSFIPHIHSTHSCIHSFMHSLHTFHTFSFPRIRCVQP